MSDKKRFNGLFILFLITVMCGCATVSRRPRISADKEAYLKDICEQNNIDWQWDQVSQVATLQYRGANAKVLSGSDIVMIGDDRVTLSAPARTVRSSVIVPIDFQSKVVSRLYQEAGGARQYVLAKIRSIAIDAGHGGKDPGAIGRSGLQEKGVVLDICQRLKKLLQQRGFEVKLTREDDTFISLAERTEMASRSNVDLFISVHANASPARSLYGVEVYSAEELGFVDRIETQRKMNEDLMFGNLSIDRNASDVKRIVSDMLYEHKQAESGALAGRISQTASKLIKTKNLGAKTERFYVLRNTLVPAILVEIGFLSNPKEEKLMETSSYRQEIAQSLAEGISDYANGK
ncbi:MAG: N-acetylmuramoyl-L-alanine amidase [Candidatus Omnitrophica bacterium]|nr:N-acetylmuramoyl-L-alanine amidase [Candidatus Omnitrophota bacterium]